VPGFASRFRRNDEHQFTVASHISPEKQDERCAMPTVSATGAGGGRASIDIYQWILFLYELAVTLQRLGIKLPPKV
jgi:hypothetical protein